MYSLLSLEEIDLNSNMLTGILSNDVDNLTELKLIQLYENFFTGTIPAALANPNLSKLSSSNLLCMRFHRDNIYVMIIF